MDFKEYTNIGIIECFELSNRSSSYKKYLPEIKKELESRLGAYEVNVKNFSKFKIATEMTKTVDDFMRSVRDER